MRLDRYEIEGELARGGMGVVYRARDPNLGREVVIKLILGALEPEALVRFGREAQAVGRLRHPNLVAVHDQGVDPQGRPYLVMELIPGRSLKAWLEEGPFDVDEAARIVERLAEGVEHAHQQGVLHRDLKPENVLLAELGGEPVLTDFGLARLEGRDTRLTLSGEAHGTPVYMPPEQANGDLELIGPTSDVYGLGGILYALLAGCPPFQGSNLLAILAAVLTDEPEAISSLRAEVDPALEAIVRRCLEKDPRHRFPSAAALAEALGSWRESPHVGPEKRHVGLAAATAGALVLGGAVLFASSWRSASSSASPVTRPTPTQILPPPSTKPPVAAPRLVHTVVLQPGPLEGKDATVRSDGTRGNDNDGTSHQLSVGRRGRANLWTYLEFRIDRYVPKGAEIRSARLELFARDSPHVFRPNGRDVPVPIVARAVVAAHGRVPWEEGTSGFDRFADGIVYGGPTRGADSKLRVHHPRYVQPEVEAPAPGARAVAPAGKGHWTKLDLTDLVKRWYRGSLRNYGFRLEPGEGFRGGCAKAFVSSDHPTVALRPKLVVVYRGDPQLQPPDETGTARLRALETLQGLDAFSPDEHFQRASDAIRRAPFLGEGFSARARGLWRQERSILIVQSTHSDCLRALNAPEPPQDPVQTLRLLATAGMMCPQERWRADHALELVSQALKQRPGDAALQASLDELSAHMMKRR